jgi:DNA invertase Pin-like site-specific DNA recombinase
MAKEQLTFNENIERLKKGIVYSTEEIERIIAEIKEQYPNTPIKRVCAYGRVSTKYEEQESSLLTQHEVFKSYCERHKSDGYVLVNEVYEQRTGTLITKRKLFQQIVEDARAGMYDILLFKSSTRFSRNRSDFIDLIEELKREKIYIIFISENVNTETANRDTLTLLGMMAESYSNSLHDSVSKAIEVKQNSELGRVPGNVFGYKRVKGNSSLAEIVPEQAELLRELFNRYAEGEGIASICKDWQERGIRTYNGGTMSMFALRRYIRNPLYKGVLEMGKFTKTDVRAKRVRTPDEDLIVRHRPDLIIIEPELWDYCNEIMDGNKRTLTEQGSFVKKTDTVKDKLFAKVIKCGECGRNYNRKESNHKTGKRYTYLMCGYKKYNKLNQANQEVCHNEKVLRLDTLTEVVSLFIKDLIMNQDNLEELVTAKINSFIEELKEKGVDKQAEEQLKEAKAKLKRFVELYKDGLISEGEYREQRAEVKRLEEEVKINNIPELEGVDIRCIVKEFISDMDNILENELDDNSGSLDLREFNKLFESITVYQDHVDIIFKVFKDRRLRRFGEIDIKQVIPEEHRDLKFICPVVDNQISNSQLVDKLVPYSIEERQYLNSIEDRELRNKIRKKLHRKKKTPNQTAERTSQVLGLNSEAVINQHTNQVVDGIRDISINLYVV